jgi:SAM-dependent methyltransferase
MPTFGLLGADPWGEDDNARHYDAFARQYPMYRQTSRDLVALAGLSDDAVVLDVACGTGATTGEVLAVLSPDGRVIGVDGSAAMLAIAAQSIADQRVTWIQARAEELDQHVTELVDAAICNSAIWQTDLAATAAAVRKVTDIGGRFVFNVGSDFLEQRDRPDERPLLSGVMRAIAAEDYGWALPGPISLTRRRTQLSEESICQALSNVGFQVEQIEQYTYEQSAEAVRAWLSVPIFTERHLPGLPYEQRMRVLEKAYRRLGPGETALSRLVVFSAKATAGRP